LSTDDIFTFVATARGRGASFLPIPDNYYDDLGARFNLEEALLAQLRALGVLYDRAKDGEFFHIYTRTFQHRFFFEIVQRRDYDLFGAANTPVRLAAQARLDDNEERVRINLDV
jgi:4-hydroxyphenylpyruvate dioxygenase